jgi:acetolactate synthase-1/2/3 large subunit
MNTMGALTTAWGVNAPVMCITGQVPSAMIGRGRGQLHEMPDQIATLKTLLKFAERIEHPTEAPQVMARAFQAMMSGRPGPVAVEVPWDMFSAVADVTPIAPLGKRANPAPDPDKIAALARLVDEARAPMIWIGGGAVDAGPEILALAEKIGAPVVSFRMGKGIVDSRHPLSLNTVGGFELWDKTDLLIGIGTRLDVPIARWAPAPAGLKTARIDIDPAEHRRLAVNVAIVADAADGARSLAAAVKHKEDPARRKAVAAAREAAQAAIQKADPQYSFMKVIREALPDDGIVVDEVTQLGYIIWYGYPVHQPRRLISSGFSGTLGYGFPTALGVKVANPDRPVVSVTGDGGFLFGGSDLATAKQFGINLVTVVVNNASYGNVLRDQQRLYEGRHAGAVLTNPDFQAYARAFGIAAWQVETADGLRGALREALASEAPAVVEVISDIAKDYPPFAFHQPRLGRS